MGHIEDKIYRYCFLHTPLPEEVFLGGWRTTGGPVREMNLMWSNLGSVTLMLVDQKAYLYWESQKSHVLRGTFKEYAAKLKAILEFTLSLESYLEELNK